MNSKIGRGVFSVALLGFALLAPNARAETGNSGSFMKALNMLPGDTTAPYGDQASCEQVRHLKHDFGVNTIAVRKNLILNTYDSAELIDRPNDGADDRQLQHQLQIDKRLGVKTFFEAAIRLQSDQDANVDPNDCSDTWHPWHGSIDYGKPEDYDKLFNTYSQKLQHYADIIKKSGNVSVFSLGHELSSLYQTKPLQDPVKIRDFIDSVAWNLRHNGHEAKSYAKQQISHLMTFTDGVNDRRTKAARNVAFPEVKSDWMQHAVDGYESAKSGVKQLLGIKPKGDDTPELRTEIKRWADSEQEYTLSDRAKNYLIQLENNRRLYLEGMWEQTINQVKSKFADVPENKRPKLTVNGSVADDIGFWDKLDTVSVSMYGSFGSVDPRDQTSIDDGKTSVEDLKKGWMRYIDHQPDPNPYHYDPLPLGLKQFMAQHPEKEVLFSELGFHRRVHSAQNSYQWYGCQWLQKPDGSRYTVHALRRKVSNEERDHAVEALRQLMLEGKIPWLKGIAMWDTYTRPKGVPDEFCVDCWINEHGNEAAPYDEEIKKLFKSASRVTNTYSEGDPCIPKPKPTPVVASEVTPALTQPQADSLAGQQPEQSQVPFIDWLDPLSQNDQLKFPYFEF